MQQQPRSQVAARQAPAGGNRSVRYVGVAGLPDGTRRIALGSGVITALLSRGGSAYVYEIWNSQLEVSRAVKLLHPDRLEETKERFETEVKITAKLHHPNIVDIYVVGNWNGLPYIEMERVDGITLEQLIAKRGAIPIEVCTAVGILVCRALDYAHNQRYMIYGREYRGIIHRDLKPGNVMLGRDGQIKLMDFGIAKPVKASSETSEGIVVGTMQYLSPEQLQGGTVDVRADLYSFGAVLYELLTGTRTFPERNLARLVTDKLSNRFQPLNKFKVSIPSRLRRLVHRCLYYQKQKRVQSANELLRELEIIHRSITDQGPEQVLRGYVKYAEDTRTVLDTRWLAPHLSTIIQIVALVVFLTGGTFLFLQIRAAIKGDSGPPPVTAPVEQPTRRVRREPQPEPEEEVDWETVEETPEPEVEYVEEYVDVEFETLPEAEAEPEPEPVAPEPEPEPVVRRQTPAVTAAPRTTPRAASPTPRPTPNPSPAPAPKPAAQPKSEPAAAGDGLLARLSAQHGTSDIPTLMEKEIQGRRYQNALDLHTQAPPDVARGTKAQILKMRALKAANKTRDLESFLMSQDLGDAEFYIEKSMWFCSARQPTKARVFYDKSMKAPGRFLGPVTLQQRRMLCRALVATANYDTNPNAQTKREAMDGWYEIKLKLQNSPNHYMYRKADTEIRRIGGRG